ncbi:flavin reductase family protein [Nonomuraea sp. NPDC002799]
MTITVPSTRDGMPERFRGFMSGFPSGVAIITTVDEQGRPWGMTCSSLCSATTQPPTLMVGLRSASPTLKALLERGSFAVNLLHERAKETAELFASGTPNRFDLVAWESVQGAGGPHLLEAAHAVADCRVARGVQVGLQHMVFGEPFRIRDLAAPEPLLYGLRQYTRWSKRPA